MSEIRRLTSVMLNLIFLKLYKYIRQLTKWRNLSTLTQKKIDYLLQILQSSL